jgi:S-adenosylmethionine hydrolase
MGPIVLLTDFGEKDWFAGVLRGVISGIAPKVSILDLGHHIPPGDIRAGAFSLWAARDHFPKGSIFVAVVDPGVGGPREALLVSAHGRHFIGPDNGLLSWAASGDPRRRIRALANPRYRAASLSSTFHGRDLFAPAAAHLARGAKPAAFGPLLKAMAELPPWRADFSGGKAGGKPGGTVRGEILHVDAFGNAITSLSAADLGKLPAPPKAARARGKAFPWKPYYGAAGAGKPLSLLGSCGLVELAVNGGNAAERHGLKRGDEVNLK